MADNLNEAAVFEGEYRWLKAAALYEEVLKGVAEEDYFRRGEIQEKIGHSLHRAAFQAESLEEFRVKMGLAVEAYEKAHDLYEKLTDERGAPWMLRCGAMSRYLSYSLASETSEKRRLLDECLELEENALKAFWDLGNKLEYGRTYNDLSMVSWCRCILEWDRQVTKGIFEKAIAWGEKAVAVLTELGDSHELARAKFPLGYHLARSRSLFIEERVKKDQLRLKAIELYRNGIEYSEGDAYLIGLYHYGLALVDAEASVPLYEQALKFGEETRDNYLKALALDYLAYETYWEAHATDDPDRRRKLAEEAMELYDKAHHHYHKISYTFSRLGGKLGVLPPGGYAEYYLDMALWEAEPEKKLDLLEKSEKAGLKALKAAEDSDIPGFIGFNSGRLSLTMTARARLETDVDTKRGLLERAMRYRERDIEVQFIINPYYYWNIGRSQYYLADIKAELAFIQPDLDSRRGLLEDAASTLETSLKTMEKRDGRFSAVYASLRGYQEAYGSILTRLHELTEDPEHLRKAIATWRMAIDSAREVDMTARIAESYWSIAKAQDVLGERSEAAESFERASESYVMAAEKIPQLKEFYLEYASYMRAWSEIERAKRHHAEKRYGEAREHYEKAAELHKSTERWSYIAPNYQAWARLDEAEDLSIRDQTEEARDLFQQAVELFRETEDSIKSKLKSIEVGEERQIAEELIKASDVRREYCLSRVALEEARILDRQGDHSTSSKRYGQAAERFQGVIDSFELESDRRELRPIVCLCRAWQRMMLAEEQMSSSLYSEAAGLFMEAREHALDQTTRLLAQAHSSFCKALEAGTEFEVTRDTALFSEAKRHIEAATNHYLRAGYRSSSDYATATNRLLDGYMYTYNAQTEMDPDRKARFYQMSERLLQDSAGLFLMAKHPEKSDEVRTILENIRGEKEIALSLAQLMHAPTIMQTTSSFSTPTPTHEQAVGLERFESADIQANLIARRREVGVGEDLDLEIELVNAGKAPAQLVKVEDIVIEGFELKSYPDICRVEDSYLDMKGRTLSPLKTQELKLVLKPLTKGAFEFKPRILYLDETGKYRSHEPDPVSITVQELGIRGWLRGPTR